MLRRLDQLLVEVRDFGVDNLIRSLPVATVLWILCERAIRSGTVPVWHRALPVTVVAVSTRLGDKRVMIHPSLYCLPRHTLTEFMKSWERVLEAALQSCFSHLSNNIAVKILCRAFIYLPYSFTDLFAF